METTLESRLSETFRKVFHDPDLEIDRSLTANDVEDWDSLTHINLIVAIEKEFQVKFTTAEVSGMKNVGDLIDLLRRKGA